MSRLWVALAFLGLNFYIYQFFALEEVIPQRESFDGFPLQFEAWSCPQRTEVEPRIFEVLGATDLLLCDYHNRETGGLVNVYVGYHESQVRRFGGSIHPPEHCLPGSGWDIIDARVVPLDLEGLPQGHGLRASGPQAKRFIVAKGNARQLVYFWYQSQGRVITHNEDVILFRFWNRATRGRTDGSLVRFMAPIVRGDVEEAEARLLSLARLVVPKLPPFLPQ